MKKLIGILKKVYRLRLLLGCLNYLSICENKSDDLVCPRGAVFHSVSSAFYGRTVTDKEVCEYHTDHNDNTNCGEYVTELVNQRQEKNVFDNLLVTSLYTIISRTVAEEYGATVRPIIVPSVLRINRGNKLLTV